MMRYIVCYNDTPIRTINSPANRSKVLEKAIDFFTNAGLKKEQLKNINVMPNTGVTFGMTATANAQQVFDHVATQMFYQGRPSLKYSGFQIVPAYRSDFKNASAVGCLISDEKYESYMEGIEDVFDLIKLWDDLEKGPIGNHTELVYKLEEIHNYNCSNKMYVQSYWETTDIMRNALEKVAHHFDLSSSIIPTLQFHDR